MWLSPSGMPPTTAATPSPSHHVRTFAPDPRNHERPAQHPEPPDQVAAPLDALDLELHELE